MVESRIVQCLHLLGVVSESWREYPVDDWSSKFTFEEGRRSFGDKEMPDSRIEQKPLNAWGCVGILSKLARVVSG